IHFCFRVTPLRTVEIVLPAIYLRRHRQQLPWALRLLTQPRTVLMVGQELKLILEVHRTPFCAYPLSAGASRTGISSCVRRGGMCKSGRNNAHPPPVAPAAPGPKTRGHIPEGFLIQIPVPAGPALPIHPVCRAKIAYPEGWAIAATLPGKGAPCL